MPPVKAIVMATKERGGFGDLIFSSQFISQLKERFAMDDFASKIDKPIFYIVTADASKAKMKELGVVAEFRVEVLTKDEFQALVCSKKIKVSSFIQGPAIDGRAFYELHILLQGLDISADLIPVISISEYGLGSYSKSDFFTMASQRYRKGYSNMESEHDMINGYAGGVNRRLDQASVICTGFDKAKGEQGTLFDKKLINGNRHTFVAMLENKVRQPLLQGNIPIDYYQANTGLSFIYCHYGHLSFYPFLRLCLESVKYKHKDEDVVMVGSNRKAAYDALKKMESALSANGFKIIFWDGETEEIINLDNDNTNKIFQVLYYPSMTHQSMLGCIGLSGELIGVTGDQSLNEAISACKYLIFYECLPHKKGMIGGFHGALIKSIKNEKLQLLMKPYLKLMSHGGYSDDVIPEETYKLLGLLCRNPHFRAVLKQATLAVLKENNLINVVADIVLKKSYPDEATMVEIKRFLADYIHGSGIAQKASPDIAENNMEQSEVSLLKLLERLESDEIDLLLEEERLTHDTPMDVFKLGTRVGEDSFSNHIEVSLTTVSPKTIKSTTDGAQQVLEQRRKTSHSKDTVLLSLGETVVETIEVEEKESRLIQQQYDTVKKFILGKCKEESGWEVRFRGGKSINDDDGNKYTVPTSVARFFNSKESPEDALKTLASEANLKKDDVGLVCCFFSKRTKDTRQAYERIANMWDWSNSFTLLVGKVREYKAYKGSL